MIHAYHTVNLTLGARHCWLVDLGFNVLPPTVETGPRFIVTSDRLETPGIEPAASGLRSDPGLCVSLLTDGEAVNLYLVIAT